MIANVETCPRRSRSETAGGHSLIPLWSHFRLTVVVCSDYMAAREEDIAWAAGLFEGEGCTTEVNGRFTTVVNNTDDWVIDRLFDVVGRGRT
jgi:hypothetical protein